MSDVKKEGYKFFQDICVPCYHTDASFFLKPSSFMDLAQEIAYWAAQSLGFGYDDLHIHHSAWVLSRMHFHFVDPPRWRDDVRLYTWHKGLNGLFYLRDFQLKDMQGKDLVTCTSSWVVIDVETRRMVRPEDLEHLLAVEEGIDHAIEEPCPKTAIPRGVEVEYCGEHVVAYSDVDIIGHTNNARYVVWAMDALDYGTVSGRRVRDVFINFNRETTPGTAVRLYRYCESDNVYYVEGRVDDKPVFCVKIVY